MRNKFRLFLLVFVCLLPLSRALAMQPFVVRGIQVEGLQRVTHETLMSYLPITVGEQLTTSRSANVVRALYKTGFFSDVRLLRRGNHLVVSVKEHPVISQVKVTGNEAITDDNLAPVLKDVGLVKGHALNPTVIKQLRQSLLHQYEMQSRYAATVEAELKPLPHNRVDVHINVNEGPVAKIRGIRIHGNTVFSERKLVKQMSMTTWRPWSFFTESDQYAENKLQEDFDKLQSFYMDRGYLKFRIVGHQVNFDQDKKHVTIDITIAEGDVYTIDAADLQGEFEGQEKALRRLITMKKGDAFSREVVMKNKAKIAEHMADQGFAMVKVDAVPRTDDQHKQVSINFNIQPGQRVTVRRIHFEGNTRTGEYVLRREMRQLEGSTFSHSQVEESKRRLANLGYLENVEVKPSPVPNHPDQLDLTFSVKESSSASANVQVGYSDVDGLLYGAHLDQRNFMGTGRAVSVAFDHSEYARSYNFSYNNPYLTPSGVSRGFSLYMQKVTPGKTNLSSYKTDTYGGDIHYGIPWSRYAHLFFSYGYEHVQLTVGSNPSDEVKKFVEDNGNAFDQFRLQGGWAYSSLNRAVFPTKGVQQHISVEVGLPITGESLDYYTLSYVGDWYQPLFHEFILRMHTQLAYGRGYGRTGSALPFFKNFYAGGIGSVRAYAGNTIGPRDSQGRSIGGNVLTLANANLILPPWFTPKVRTSLFFDVGSVGRDEVGDLRYSAGVTVKWRSPMAPLVFSLGKAFNPKHNNAEAFQFSIGTGL